MAKKNIIKKFFGQDDGDSYDEFDFEADNSSNELNSYEEEKVADDQTDAELAIEMYDDGRNIVIKAMVAGIDPDEDLEINVERSIITVSGTRHENHEVSAENYYHQELYWGSFSRTITLPSEVEPQEAKAEEQHGLLTITVPKIDKKRTARVSIKSR